MSDFRVFNAGEVLIIPVEDVPELPAFLSNIDDYKLLNEPYRVGIVAVLQGIRDAVRRGEDD